MITEKRKEELRISAERMYKVRSPVVSGNFTGYVVCVGNQIKYGDVVDIVWWGSTSLDNLERDLGMDENEAKELQNACWELLAYMAENDNVRNVCHCIRCSYTDTGDGHWIDTDPRLFPLVRAGICEECIDVEMGVLVGEIEDWRDYASQGKAIRTGGYYSPANRDRLDDKRTVHSCGAGEA